MWTSDRSKRRMVEEPTADLGAVTLGEEPAGVYLEGERRWTQVYSPGGYSWRPVQGDQVLVLKAGGEGEIPCIVGRKQPDGLEEGDVAIESGEGKSAVRLHSGGELALEGLVTVNGTPLNVLIENIVLAILGL